MFALGLDVSLDRQVNGCFSSSPIRKLAPNQKACILTQRFWGKAEIFPSPSQDESTRYLTVAVHVVCWLGRWMWLQPYVLKMSILRWSSRRLCVYPSRSSFKQTEIPKFPTLKLDVRSYSTEKGYPFRAQCRSVVLLSTGNIQDLQYRMIHRISNMRNKIYV